jgi:hypothetical protein
MFHTNINTKVYCTELNNTLIKGNIVEGCKYYMGIPEYLYSIDAVSSTDYPTYDAWRSQYDYLMSINDNNAYLLPLEIYDSSQDTHIIDYWLNVLSKYFIDYTKQKIFYQSVSGQIWIISTAPTVYINPIINYSPISKILGVDTDNIITSGVGKVNRLLENTSISRVVGYIGTDWNIDGPIMSYLRNNNRCKVDLLYVCHIDTTNNDKTNIYVYAIPFIYA